MSMVIGVGLSRSVTQVSRYYQHIGSGPLTSNPFLVSSDANGDLSFLMQDTTRSRLNSGTSNADLGFLTQGTHCDNYNTGEPIIPTLIQNPCDLFMVIWVSGFPLTRHGLA